MSKADLSIHRVTRVTTETTQSGGTNWTEWHFFDEYGEEVCEVTAFHTADKLDLTEVESYDDSD